MAGIFKRVEKKYLLTEEQSRQFIEMLGDRIVDDRYTLCGKLNHEHLSETIAVSSNQIVKVDDQMFRK